MRRSSLNRSARLLAIALGAALATGSAQAQSLDEVISKHLQARGGLEKIRAIRSAKLTGKMTMGPGMEAPLTLKWKSPSAFRMEFSIQGMTGIQAYDGTTGWQVMPFMGKTDAEKMSEEDLKQAEDQADFNGPLVDWKEKGYQVELIGKESLEGTEAWKLKVTKKNGDVTFIWIDADASLVIRESQKRTMQGQEMEFDSILGDYKEVGGILFAHSIEVKAKGAPISQNLVLDKIELNVDLPASEFAMPAAKPAAAPSGGPASPVNGR